MIALLQEGICKRYFSESNMYIIISMIAVILIGYLLGSLNFSIIISKVFYKDDIRKHDSKSQGMNIMRTYGKKAAGFTLAGEILKIAAAVLIGAVLLGDHVMGFTIPGTYLGGLAGIIGHTFPVYYKFRGGDGIIPAATMILCTDWLVFIIIFIMFFCIVWWTKYLSLGSIMSALIYPLILYRMTQFPGFHVIAAIFVMFLVLFLHRSNMHRLWKGTESKLNLNLKTKKQ